MYQKAPVDITKIPSLVEQYRGDLKFVPDANPYFIYKPRNGVKDNDNCFEQLNSVIENVKNIIF